MMWKKHKIYCCLFSATMVTQRRHSVTLWVHCQSFRIYFVNIYSINPKWPVFSLSLFYTTLLTPDTFYRSLGDSFSPRRLLGNVANEHQMFSKKYLSHALTTFSIWDVIRSAPISRSSADKPMHSSCLTEPYFPTLGKEISGMLCTLLSR